MTARPCAECGAPAAPASGPALCPACALGGALAPGVPDDRHCLEPSLTGNAVCSSERVERLGDFELLDIIGRGGMGIIYRARQVSLDRIVAIKMLPPGVASADALRRFRVEASTAAALQHPNIVSIHEVGEWEGRQYLVMDYVAGQSLAERIMDAGERRIDFEQAARGLMAVADAVQHAHDRGILHRDIKPSNVLIDERGEPRLTDFGLAKYLCDTSGPTLSGQAVGSPSFMSPEQAGSHQKVSPRSDVYGMGATLYQSLTRRAPFQGETPAEVLHDVLTREPPAPRSIDPAIPRDLETICLTCLRKDPARRYATAGAVADDLRRYLAGEPISARPVRALERAWRWLRKKPLAAAVVLCVLVAGGLGKQACDASRQLRREARQRALDAAIDKAWSGDRKAAARAIAEAEGLGVAPEWVRMLRGQAALSNVRNKEALAEFRSAVSLAPTSVAARAMLATGLLWNGFFDEYEELAAQLRTASPDSAEDYVFLGIALISLDGDSARPVALLEEAVRKRPTGAAFANLALAKTWHAGDAGSWPLAVKAMEHADTALQILGPRHPAVACIRLMAADVAMGLCPDSERAALSERAAASERELEPTGVCRMQRAFYFERLGDADAEMREWEVYPNSRGIYANYYAAAMLQRNRSAAALEAMRPLDPSADGYTTMARAYLLLDAGRRDDAETLYRRNAGEHVSSRLFAEGLLLLAGDPERVAANSRQLLATLPSWHFSRPVFRFWAGDLAEESLLAASGPSRVAQSTLRFGAGMAALGRGDRVTAAAHFRSVVAAGTQWRVEYQWSRAFLARLDADPSWPARLQKPRTLPPPTTADAR